MRIFSYLMSKKEEFFSLYGEEKDFFPSWGGKKEFFSPVGLAEEPCVRGVFVMAGSRLCWLSARTFIPSQFTLTYFICVSVIYTNIWLVVYPLMCKMQIRVSLFTGMWMLSEWGLPRRLSHGCRLHPSFLDLWASPSCSPFSLFTSLPPLLPVLPPTLLLFPMPPLPPHH